MKNYAKVGGRKGKPGYRTPATFRAQKAEAQKTIKQKDKLRIEATRRKDK